jgi:hypothetical protein
MRLDAKVLARSHVVCSTRRVCWPTVDRRHALSPARRHPELRSSLRLNVGSPLTPSRYIVTQADSTGRFVAWADRAAPSLRHRANEPGQAAS